MPKTNKGLPPAPKRSIAMDAYLKMRRKYRTAGEEEMEMFLSDCNIPYETMHVVYEDKRPYTIDIYIPELKMGINVVESANGYMPLWYADKRREALNKHGIAIMAVFPDGEPTHIDETLDYICHAMKYHTKP